jgi:putative membrane protein
MMFWYGHDMQWWGYAGMATLTAVLCVLLIVGVAMLAKYLLDDRSEPRRGNPEWSTPDDILGLRYAQGEITEAEYRDRLAVLHEHGWR